MQYKVFSAIIIMLLAIAHAQAALPNQTQQDKPFPSLAPMIKEVHPAVVNISTFSTQQYSYNPLLNDPFFRHFFNIPDQHQHQQQPKKRQQSAGSGVVVNAGDGIVMTNYHVIKGADEVQVSLSDGRHYDAKVLGEDAELDIAILKIEADDLVEVKIADSDQLRVGDFVVAIGNPFGLRQTVTSGIVSGLGRSGLGIEGYEDFIQTDASINPGNSGGALVNLRGELIGINTAIIAPSGGSVGINFAIPINMVLQLKPQLVKYGEVKRGHLGIEVQDLTPALAQALNIDIEQGALISTVQEGSVAAKAGLRSGDVVVMANAKPIENASDLRNIYGLTRVGESIEMDVLRGSQFLKIVATLTDELAARTGDDLHPRLQGATFSDMTSGEGVLVSNLEIGSLAHSTGLQQGDIIQAANRKRVNNLEGFRSAVKARNSLMLNIRRGSNNLLILLQ